MEPEPESLMSLSPPSLSKPVMPVAPQTPVVDKLGPAKFNISMGEDPGDSPKAMTTPKPAPPGATVCKCSVFSLCPLNENMNSFQGL